MRKEEDKLMGSGDYPLIISIVLFVILLILDGCLVALHEAADNVSDVENDKKSDQTVHIFLVLCCFINGLFCLPVMGDAIMEQIKVGNQWLSFGVECLLLLIAFLLILSAHILAIKIGYFKAEGVIKALLPFGRFMTVLMTPFRVISEGIGALLVRLVGIDPHQSIDDVTEEEIISMVNEGQEQGLLESTEAEMIHNIFEFTDTEVQDVMTHRKNMITISGDLTVNQALDFMLETVNSRFPVYGEDMDNILGVIHIKDCMMLTKEKGNGRKKLSQIEGLIREVDFIPETRNISDLFRQMQLKKQHMVIVVDEYGQTSGLVTLEDILEEIVGNIFDEYDEEDTSVQLRQDGSYVFEGITPLEEVEELLGANLPIDDFETLNGYLISLIDRIPEDDEVIEIREQDYIFKVLSVDNKMIQSVHVQYSPVENDENLNEEEER